MLFAIHAFEQRYGGMHGIEDYEVIEASSEKDAEDCAREMSLDVISTYIEPEFREEAEEEDINDYNELEEYINDCIEEDIDYEIWQVNDNTGYSLDTLTDMFYNNPDEFVNNYCSPFNTQLTTITSTTKQAFEPAGTAIKIISARLKRLETEMAVFDIK